MRQTILRRRSDVRFPVAEALWVIASAILLLALGDVVIVLILALAGATMATTWWMRRDAGHHAA